MIRNINKLARRTAIAAGLVAAAWLLAGFVLVPYALERAIAGHDASPARTLAAERIAFNPLTLTATFGGVELIEGSAAFTAERVRMNLSMTGLFGFSAVLDELAIERARLALAGDLGADRVAELVERRARALPDFAVAALTVTDTELSLADTAARGGADPLVARVTLSARRIEQRAVGLAIGSFALRAQGAGSVVVELSGRLALDPTVASGQFLIDGLELARLGDRVGGDFAARAPNGVLDARGRYSLAGGGTFRTLQLSRVSLGIADASLRLADGGAVSARELAAEVDAEVDLAARAARATASVTLTSPMLSRANDEAAVLGAEHVAADEVTLALPGPAVETTSARVEGWRAQLDLAQPAPPLPGWDLSVGGIELAGGRLEIVDSSTAPAVAITVEDTRGRLAGLEAGGLPREIELEGRLGGTAGDGTLSARLRRLGPSRFERADVRIDGLAAAALSPYAERFADMRVTSGRADLELSYRPDAPAGGFSDWTVEALELTPLESASAREPGGSEDERAAAPGEPLWLTFAAALATDAQGRAAISVPLGVSTGARAETAVPYLPGIAGAALARHVRETVSAPFDVLARLTEADAETLRAVPFAPGSAELSAAADERLAMLTRALEQRPRLAVGTGGRYAAADRDALAAEQIRVHVALATAEAARADPTARLDLASPRTQDVLDEFAGQRLAASTLDELAERFGHDARAAPSERVPYYEAVYAALAENQPVTDQMRNRLARYRAQAIAAALESHGLDAARIVDTGTERAAEAGSENSVLVPLVLTAAPR